MSNNIIQWYENAAFDKPELRSPQPCPRGVYCQYKIPNKDTKELEIACCRMVHPGEEGNGRRLFPARNTDGRQQPACVRLTGNAGFYERCRLKQPWRVWATDHNIPLPPTDVPWIPVTRGPIQRGSKTSAYSESQMDAFRGLADYNDYVSRQETKEYLRRKAAGIPSSFDLAKQKFPEVFESFTQGVSAAPTSWPSLQGSSGIKIAYEGGGPMTTAEKAHLEEQQRRVDAPQRNAVHLALPVGHSVKGEGVAKRAGVPGVTKLCGRYKAAGRVGGGQRGGAAGGQHRDDVVPTVVVAPPPGRVQGELKVPPHDRLPINALAKILVPEPKFQILLVAGTISPDAVTDPVTFTDPVISEFPCERKPFFIMNSFAISFPYPRLC